jgi:hypothetical protein
MRTLATQPNDGIIDINSSSGSNPVDPLAKEQAAIGASVPAPKQKNRKAKSTTIQLVQLQELHSHETIQEHFYPVVRRSDFSNFKWIKNLENQLQKLQRQNITSKSKMEHAQDYLQKQSRFISAEMKTAFWDLILVKNSHSNKQKQSKKSSAPPKKHIELFQKVRKSAVDFPLFWSATRKRKMNKQNQLVQPGKTYPWKVYLSNRSKILAVIHNAKSSEEQLGEATRLVTKLQNSLPPNIHERLIQTFQDHVIACEQDQRQQKGLGTTTDPATKKKRKKRIQILYSNIRTPVKSHIHLVAPDLADFLYLTMSDDGVMDRNDVTSDPRVTEGKKEFENIMERFADSFMNIHNILLREFQTNIQKQEAREEELRNSSGEEEDSEEAVLESFNDAVTAGLQSLPSKVSAKKKDGIANKPRKYIYFEAIALQDFTTENEDTNAASTMSLQSSSFEIPHFPTKSADNRMVIIDNLPIDVDESLLADAYSRCGPVASLKVFNRRPHLDPGRKSADSRKKIRNPSSFRQQWQRPRTPLYAMILFQDETGAAKATSDPLRIFGMVLDRHLIRSYKSQDMTKLYLEDVSGKYDMTTIEYQLSQLLHPELYICLDIDGDQRPLRRQTAVSNQTSSFIIKFPDFESAYWSYLKLTSELDFLKDADCELQWMESPKDAMLYWTRKLNF